MQTLQWARLKENVKTPLPEGAWYRVLTLTPPAATLAVAAMMWNGVLVNVSRLRAAIERAVGRECSRHALVHLSRDVLCKIAGPSGDRRGPRRPVAGLQPAITLAEAGAHCLEHPRLRLDGGLRDDHAADRAFRREPHGHLDRPVRAVHAHELQQADHD